ncbi:MAG: hypothetical protein ACO3A4_02495 [Silvanigrellaceae bacterium]
MLAFRIPGFGNVLAAGIFAVAGLALIASCGRTPADSNATGSRLASHSDSSGSFEVEKISFEQWCERWGLTCSEKPKPIGVEEAENLADSKEFQQWQAISQLFEDFSRSGSNFSMVDDELTSSRVRLLMAQIGLQDVHQDLMDVLQRSGLRKVAIERDGRIRFEGRSGINNQSGVLRGRSGMKWTFESQGGVSVGSGGNYLFNGLLFSAANSFESDVFGKLGYNDTDKTVWSGANLAVTNIPEGFFIRDVPVRWEKFSDINRVPLLRNVTELRNLVFTQGRNVRVNSAFFNTAARNMPVFVDDAKIVGAVTRLVDSFGLLELKEPTAGAAFAQLNLESASSVMCRIEMSGTPPIELTLDKRFGVQNVYTNEKFNAQIDLFGINIKARVGLPISFNPKRIDVEPTRIVVKGVPVIGEISIPLPDEKNKFGKELKKLECNERL